MFNVGKDITKAADPANGSIQRLYAEDTNLIIFQEDKVSRALIDKDAIFTAEGSAITTSGKLVIGQITPISGEWGIATNPESFADYGYAKYFVDRHRGAVLRLAGGQITEISNYGMIDFFRDQSGLVSSTGKIVGGYDIYKITFRGPEKLPVRTNEDNLIACESKPIKEQIIEQAVEIEISANTYTTFHSKIN